MTHTCTFLSRLCSCTLGAISCSFIFRTLHIPREQWSLLNRLLLDNENPNSQPVSLSCVTPTISCICCICPYLCCLLSHLITIYFYWSLISLVAYPANWKWKSTMDNRQNISVHCQVISSEGITVGPLTFLCLLPLIVFAGLFAGSLLYRPYIHVGLIVGS